MLIRKMIGADFRSAHFCLDADSGLSAAFCALSVDIVKSGLAHPCDDGDRMALLHQGRAKEVAAAENGSGTPTGSSIWLWFRSWPPSCGILTTGCCACQRCGSGWQGAHLAKGFVRVLIEPDPNAWMSSDKEVFF